MLAVSALILVFGLWWLYFDRNAPEISGNLRASFTWGYGHWVIVMATAAIGAGLAVAVDRLEHHAQLSDAVAGLAVGVPVSVWISCVRLIRGAQDYARPATAALVLAASLTPAPVLAVAALVAALAVATTWKARREAL